MCWKRWFVNLSNLSANYERVGRGQNRLCFQLFFAVMQRNFAPCFGHSARGSAGSLCALSPSMNLGSCTSPTTLPLLPRGGKEAEKHLAALLTRQQQHDMRFKHGNIDPSKKNSSRVKAHLC